MRPEPPSLTSPAYGAAFNDVKVVGNAAVPDQAGLATYQFWQVLNDTTRRILVTAV